MAVLLPLLVTIVLACVDLGRFAYSYVAVTNAARAGAGYAVMNPFTILLQPQWEADVRQAAADEMHHLRALFNANTDFFDENKLFVQATRTIEPTGLWRARVEVHYPFQTTINWPLLPWYDPPLTLKQVVVIRGIR